MSKIPLNVVEICGYSDVRTPDMLPAIVPPVFCFKDGRRFIVPPYTLIGNHIYGATEILENEAMRLMRRRELKIFPSFRFDPQRCSTLWIDRKGVIHYEDSRVAQDSLQNIATEAIDDATNALKRGDLIGAENLSGLAILASDCRVEAWAIKVALRRHRNDPKYERLVIRLASPFITSDALELLVVHYLGLIGTKI